MAKKPARGFSERRTRHRAKAGARALKPAPSGRRVRFPGPEALPDGTVRYFLTLGPKGRVLLPADMRAAMGLSEGDLVLGWLKDGELCLESQKRALAKVQQENARLRGPRSTYASDDLIAERRAENAKDEEDALRYSRSKAGRRP